METTALSHTFSVYPPLAREKSAWVSISGRVFVSKFELEERIEDKFPLYKKEAREKDISVLNICTPAEEKEAFQEVAQEKVSEIFKYDHVLKLNETDFDMKTYR